MHLQWYISATQVFNKKIIGVHQLMYFLSKTRLEWIVAHIFFYFVKIGELSIKFSVRKMQASVLFAFSKSVLIA